jgi:hypothetical protein
VQILRFDDEAKASPNRKKSSRSLLILGLIGALFGISSAFASSTISINAGNGVDLGQGVSLVAACDPAISVVPSTAMKIISTAPTFLLETVTVSGVDLNAVVKETGHGCRGKTFDLQVFKTDNSVPAITSAYSCTQLGFSDPGSVIVYVDKGSSTSTCSSSAIHFSVPLDQSGDGQFTLTFNDAPADISYFTLVSHD